MQTENRPKERTQLSVLQGINLSIQNENYYEKEAELGKMMDLEQISLMGKLEHFCPYFYEKQSAVSANIVLMPYNYLFDQR